MSTLRDKILAADDIEARQVEVPEWGVTVEIRTPTVRRRGELMAEFMQDGELDYVKLYPALVVATAYDPDSGEQLFTIADMDALAEKSAKALETLGEVAVELAGMTNAAQKLDAGKGDS